MLKLLQFNMLASQWLGKEYSLLPCSQLYFSSDRIDVGIRYLKSFTDIDVYCLCEVTEETLPKIKAAFPDYLGVVSYNKNVYWKEWLNPEIEYLQNGTCILFSKKLNFIDAFGIDYGDGSRSISAVFSFKGARVRIVSVHFDEKAFIEQWHTLCNFLDENPADVDIVSGDFNTNPKVVFKDGYNIIEHRNFKSSTTPIFHNGEKGGIDNTYIKTNLPIDFRTIILKPTKGKNIVDRMCDTVAKNGSDHYASITSIYIK